MFRIYGIIFLALLFQNGLSGQNTKQKIEWIQYFDGIGISKQKRTINYNENGNPTSEYLKREGIEEKISVYQYDKKGRILKVKDDSGTELYSYYKGFYVLKKFYEYHHRSSDDTQKLGEKGLRKIIDYQYND